MSEIWNLQNDQKSPGWHKRQYFVLSRKMFYQENGEFYQKKPMHNMFFIITLRKLQDFMVGFSSFIQF